MGRGFRRNRRRNLIKRTKRAIAAVVGVWAVVRNLRGEQTCLLLLVM